MTADLSSFGAAPACVHMELLFFIMYNALALVPSCTTLSNRTAFPVSAISLQVLGPTLYAAQATCAGKLELSPALLLFRKE
jgi:hypothetical protein